MLAVRSNEAAAAAAGVSVAGTKMWRSRWRRSSPGSAACCPATASARSPPFFGSLASLSLLAVAYLGGIASISGAVIGGVLVLGGVAFTVLFEWFASAPRTAVLGGLGLVVTAVLNPKGMAGALRRAGGSPKQLGAVPVRRACGPPRTASRWAAAG